MLTTTELEIVEELAKRPMRRYVAHIYHYEYAGNEINKEIKWTTEITFETDGNPYDDVDKYIRENDEVFGHLALEVDVYNLDGNKEYVKKL